MGRYFVTCISELRPRQTTDATLYNFHQGQEVVIRKLQWEGICALYIRITPASKACTYEVTLRNFPQGLRMGRKSGIKGMCEVCNLYYSTQCLTIILV